MDDGKMILKKKIGNLLLLPAALLLIFSPGCSLDNSPDTATVTVDLGLREKGEVRNVTGKDAAPAGITGISLTVSAPDMRTQTEVIPLATGKITLNVPAGKARLFRVTAYDPTGNLGGSATANLEAGTPADLTIAMSYQYTGVTINLNYPDGTPASATLTYNIDITDSASNLPVYGPQGFSPGTPFQVPSGDNKDIEILVSTPSVTFRGTVTGQSLPEDGTASFNVDVTLYETKIIVPDYQNTRVVQIDNFTKPNWTTITTVTGLTTPFRPYGIAFDKIGRIYIANNYGPSGMGDNGVIRLNDLNDTAPYFYPDAATRSSAFYDTGVTAVAIDRNNDVIYYAIDNGLFKASISDNTTHTALLSTNLSGIKGLAVDDTGLLYIACSVLGAGNVIQKYDPSGMGAFLTTYSIATGTPWDVMYRAPYLYAANFAGAVNNQVIQLDTGMNRIDGIGTYYFSITPGVGDFYGARRFLAIKPNGFIIADDGVDGGTNVDRLISFDDLYGTGWATYGSEGAGVDQFGLLYVC